MSDAISRLLVEREALEQGLPATLVLSVSAHVALVGAAVIVPMLLPQRAAAARRRRLRGRAAARRRRHARGPRAARAGAGGEAGAGRVRGSPAAAGRAQAAAEGRAAPDALPLPNARRVKRPATPPPVRATGRDAPSAPAAAGTTPAGRGTASATPGLEFGPPGPGVPTGTDSGGDWYLAGVQQKIWMIWNQQLKAGHTQSVGVTFTILPDGQVTGVRVTQPSGVSLLDMAAQRAILNAAPFGPLPRDYGQNPRTIEASSNRRPVKLRARWRGGASLLEPPPLRLARRAPLRVRRPLAALVSVGASPPRSPRPSSRSSSAASRRASPCRSACRAAPTRRARPRAARSRRCCATTCASRACSSSCPTA